MSKQTASANAVVDDHSKTAKGLTLLEDEVILAKVHPSWANWLKPIGLAAALGLAALVTIAVGDIRTSVGELAGVGMFLVYVHLARSHSHYIVTNQRVKKTVGLLSTSTAETRISDIKALTTQQGFIERVLNEGSVNIDSAGDDGFIGLRGVADHEHLAGLIRKQQQQVAPNAGSM